MENHVITYILLLSGSLAAFKTSDKAGARYVKLLFFFCSTWLLHLFFCSLETMHGRYEMSAMITDGSLLLFMFVPASNVYPRSRLYERQLNILDWNYLRHMSEKLISDIKSYVRMEGSFYATKTDAETRLQHSLFLTKERAAQIEIRMRKHLEEKKPYLQTGYSLQMLSDETQISVHHLSAFINEYYKINFNNFINEHRVVICIEKLLQNEWQFKKLEAIAQECGFNNRNTFTSAFKKTTGLNPSEFLKQIKLKNSKSAANYMNKGTASFDDGQMPSRSAREDVA